MNLVVSARTAIVVDNFLQHEEWHQDIEWIWTILDAQSSCCQIIHNHHLKPSICQTDFIRHDSMAGQLVGGTESP